MFRKFINRADRILALVHGILWAVVMVVWSFAWRAEPGPMGPPFNFAKRFLSRIDGVLSRSIVRWIEFRNAGATPAISALN